MSGFFNVSNNSNSYFSGLFGSTSSTGSSQGFSLNSLMGDYYAIKNGTYLKLAKKFYASDSAGSSSSTKSNKTTWNSKVDTSTGVSSSGKKTAAMESVDTAMSSLGKLMSSDLYNKTVQTDEEGNKTKDYDRTAILDGLKDFVENYNTVVTEAGDSDNNQTLTAGVRLVNQTKVYASALQKVGISIKSDNTLSIDEEAFGKADITDVKSLFTGSISFGKNVQNKMLQIYNAESSAQNNWNNLYSSRNVTNLSIGSMFDSMF